MRIVILLLAYSVRWSSASCSAFKTFSYITAVNDMLTCLNIDDSVSLADFAAFTSGETPSCTSESDPTACETEIRNYIEANPDSVIASVGQALLDSPETSCPCVQDATALLDNCIPALNNYAAYCSILSGDESINDDCSIAALQVCAESSTYEEVISCLEENLQDLSGACADVLNSLLADIFADCAFDIATMCLSTDTTYIMTCLIQHYDDLSPACRENFDQYIGGISQIPCAEEAAEFCPGETDPYQVLTCLSEVNQGGSGAQSDQFSDACKATLIVFDQCMAAEVTTGQHTTLDKKGNSRSLQDAGQPLPCFPSGGDGSGDGGNDGDDGADDDGGSTNKNGNGSDNSSSGGGSGAMQGLVVAVVVLSVAFVAVALYAYRRGIPSVISSPNASARGYTEHDDGHGGDVIMADRSMASAKNITPTNMSDNLPELSSSSETESPIHD